jgi:hypothetical protein
MNPNGFSLVWIIFGALDLGLSLWFVVAIGWGANFMGYCWICHARVEVAEWDLSAILEFGKSLPFLVIFVIPNEYRAK